MLTQYLSFGSMIRMIILGLIGYASFTIPNFQLYRKAKMPTSWLAFIPIANFVPFFRVIRVRLWNFVWIVLGVVGEILLFALHNFTGDSIGVTLFVVPGVFSIIWLVKLFKAFSMSAWWLLLLIGSAIPILDVVCMIWLIVLFWIMAFSSKYQYEFVDESVSEVVGQ